MAHAELDADQVIAACVQAINAGTTYLGHPMDANSRNKAMAIRLLAQCVKDQNKERTTITITVSDEDIRFFGHCYITQHDREPALAATPTVEQTAEQRVYGKYAGSRDPVPPAPSEPSI